MVAALLLLICIISYTRTDEPSTDISLSRLLTIPFDEELKAKADQVQNRLGLVGAILADALINGTIGYAAVVFPLLLGVWGWFILRGKLFLKLIHFSNYTLLFAMLFCVSAGIANVLFGGVDKEFSGITGVFIAGVLTKLFGNAGASIILLTAFFITLVFAIDLDVHRTIDRVKNSWTAFIESFSSRKPSVTIRVREEDKPLAMPSIRRSMPPMDEEIEERERSALIDVSEAKRSSGELEVEAEVQKGEETHEHVPKLTPPTDAVEEIDYVFPSVDLLDLLRQSESVDDEELKANAELLRAKLARFSVAIENVSVTPGPVVTLYELVPASDVKISRIVSLADDLALALAAKGIRIIAPIPGKSAVGVEIPNHHPSIVSIRSVINSTRFRDTNALLPITLGKTISGEVYVDDLAKMPHLLIAGATGSGKSIGINTIVTSLLYKLHPSDVKFIIIDPKKIELALYAKLRNHFLATSPDVHEDIITSPENAVSVLKSVELEMEKRYDRLAAAGVRNIQDYNERLKSGRLKDTESQKHHKIPYLIVIIDELADLMLTAAKEVEEPIARLAQLARAVGIHLVLATQRPSVDVITGVIKANFSARIAYQVSSKVDSRTILDMNGAEQLLGNGDMLYLAAGSMKPVRLQNAFISTDEVERVVDHIACQQGYSTSFMLPSLLERKKTGFGSGSGERDELFEEAARLVVRHQQGSVSLLQRRLKVGYSRAARLIDELEVAGIVGPFDGSKAREVLVENEADLENILRELS